MCCTFCNANFRLYRDATRYVDGCNKKDLTALNRDLSKVILTMHTNSCFSVTKAFLQVIVVDWNEKVVDCNRENALLLKKWEGDNSDRSLIGLAQLLQGEAHIFLLSRSNIFQLATENRCKWHCSNPIDARHFFS